MRPNASIADKIPMMIPSTRKGQRINQFVAPTAFIMLISRLLENIVIRTVFAMMKSETSSRMTTIAMLMPYTSDCYDGIGVKPDYDIELKSQTDDLKKDTQYQQALASVMSMQRIR